MNQNICPTCHAPIAQNAPGGFCPVCLLREASDEGSFGKRSTPSLLKLSEAFPELEILELIGQGGMAFVYKARQRELDRVVALKILSPDLGSDPSFEERFSREARVLGKLQHPNVVSIYEQGKSGGYFYLMMEYVDGVNLRQAMAAGRFTPEQALAMVPGICDALQAAHSQGIWHRDIKPENILLDQKGQVKIVDFGIARIVGDSQRNFTLTQTGGVLGSAAYMAPEQHESPRDVDHRADIYSLGVVIYEMLTGELPLGRFPNPSSRAEVNGLVDEVVLRTLEKERDLRQQSVEEVKTDLAEASTRAVEKVESAEVGLSRFVMWVIAMFVGGGVLGALGIPVRSAFAIAIGGAVCAVGFLGCLWSLWQMKSGAWSPKGRGLLIALVVFPLCAGVVAMSSWILLNGIIFERLTGNFLGGLGLVLIVITILLYLPISLGRPLGSSACRRRWLGRLSLMIGAFSIISGGIVAKRTDGKWPFVGNKAFTEIILDPSSSPSVPELRELALKAGGKYSDNFTVEVDPAMVSVTACCSDEKFPIVHSDKKIPIGLYRDYTPSQSQIGAFYQRFTTLLPADKLPKSAFTPIKRISGRAEASRIRQVPTHLIIIGSVLIALAGGRRMWWVMAGGSVFLGLLASLPVWKGEIESPSLVEGSPLPPFGYEEMPPADFSTPEKAVMSFYDAASQGEVDVVKRGASRAVRQILDEHNQWPELLRRSGRQSAHSPVFDPSNGIFRVTTVSPRSSGHLYVVKEDGEWKVDDIAYGGRTGPFSLESSPAFALRELLAAAKNGDAETFRARLSEALGAEIKEEEGGRPNFGDFGKVKFVEVSELKDETAKILVESIAEPKRRWTFTMILEDGQWKLSKDGF